MFLPTTEKEMKLLGWNKLDVIIISGDAYIDSPFSGAAVVGKTLADAGYRVGIISQPDMESNNDILRLGSPALYWGITAGATDSLVANYTASGRKRKSCDFTPGGINNQRPDRASIAYSNLIKRFDPDKMPIVLGGIEASLRRLSHYDLLTEKIRRPILFDAKADYLIHGMGEFTAVLLANRLSKNESAYDIPGICYIAKQPPVNALILPSHEETANSKEIFHKFFYMSYRHASSMSTQALAQECNGRWLVQNQPYAPTSKELDHVYELGYERNVHPYDAAKGRVAAAETTKYSVTTHRGCYGECNFCAITAHQGRSIISRSENSIINEIMHISKMPGFNGIITDVGGPTANMYKSECKAMKIGSPCKEKRCLFPSVCPSLASSQEGYTALLKKLRGIEGIKQIRVSSGIRTDLAVADVKNGLQFINDLAKYHTGGQIKLAPEHTEPDILRLMGKCGIDSFLAFTDIFGKASRKENKKQYITCYFMAAHPGSTAESMKQVKKLSKRMKYTPEQVQIFTPTPSTWSTCMYYTGIDFMTGNKVHSVKSIKEKTEQKDILTK